MSRDARRRAALSYPLIGKQMPVRTIRRARINVNSLGLFYRDTLSGHQTILCLHGKYGRGETWSGLMSRYRERYRIIAPDQRGHGLSDKPVARYAGDDLATDIHELIEKLECGPCIVIGHSMGARVAAHLAAFYPQDVKAVVILEIAGVSGPEKPSDLPPDQVVPMDRLTAEWPTPYATYEDAIQDLALRFERESGRRYFLESLVETVDGYDFMFSRYSMAAIREYGQNVNEVLPRIHCPVLFVRGANSSALSREEAERMSRLIENCIFVEIPSAGHRVYSDNPDELYRHLDRFLLELE